MTVVSDVSAHATDYLATHEVIMRNTENLIFDNIDKIRTDREWDAGPNNTKCARLNGGVDSLRIGTALLLNVMAGDNFELSAHAYYESNEHNSSDPQYADNAGMLESLIATLTGRGFGGMPGPGDGPGGGPGGGGDFGAVETMLNWDNFNQFGEIRSSMTDSSMPQAYINYLMFDEQMQLVPEQSGAVQVTGACADAWSVIGTGAPINIKNNGHLLIYIDGVRTKDVFFDDLHVLHKKGRLLEENHYYPHGLTIRAGASNPVPTREGYQGKELQDEAGLELYDFHARQYDPQIGRFWGIDPADQFPSGYTGMGNNPANMVDPSGAVAYGAGASYQRQNSDFENAENRRWGARENYWNSEGEEFSMYDWNARGSGNSEEGQGTETKADEKDSKKDDKPERNNEGVTANSVASSAVDGFQAGYMQTWKTFTTWDGFSSFLASSALFGVTGPSSLGEQAAGIAVNINKYSGNDFAYGSGYVAEKIIEGVVLKKIATSISTISSPGFGERLFLSEKYGITSTRFGSAAVTGKHGTLNTGGGLFKAGWATGKNSLGEWGYKFRFGIGSKSTNTNIARFHLYFPNSFVPNGFANPSIALKRAIYNAGKNP